MKIIVQFLVTFAFGAVLFAGMKTAQYFMGPVESQIIVCLVSPADSIEECRPFQDWASKGGV